MQKRIIFKILSSGVNFFISIFLGLIIPRIIGPKVYGDYSYVISTYAFFLQILLFSSNTAYIYFLSTKKHEIQSINSFYFIYLFVVAIITIAISIFSFNLDLGLLYLWNDITDLKILILGLVFGLLFNLQQRLIDYSDSSFQTIKSEKIRLLTKLIVLVLVVIFISLNIFNIYGYFIINILSIIIFIGCFFRFIKIKIEKFRKNEFIEIFNDFYIYLKPLFIFAVVSSIYSYFGKYVLQSSSGSLAQGYFNFALQITMIPVGFIYSLMSVFLSDMTKLNNKKDVIGLKNTFNFAVDKLFVLHAVFSLFLLINAKELVVLLVGESYLNSVPAIKVLSIFSLLNTLGMISSNIFYSTGRNKLYSTINTSIMFLGILCYVFYYLSDNKLNALDLSLIMLFIYSLRLFIQLIYNLNYMKIKKFKFFVNLIKMSLLILLIIYFVNLLSLALFFNVIITITILILANFVFKDYLDILSIKKIIKT
jgi:O-antigen/teichoic acid export membrane protein